MAHFTVAELNAWSEPTKLTLSAIDSSLELQVATQVLPQLASVFNTSTWTNDATTPALVRSIMAMYYVAWIYDRTYSEDAESNEYSQLLRTTAQANINGLINGTVILAEDPTANAYSGTPSFYPNDASSALAPTAETPSDGPPSFMIGTVF